ncbi:2252_t:CDS:1 [Funneliformis mosseae]|uniref:2252_t:CDS:1 n=1 Tax=Funneliformis mosseae TaxID=27381 RepID=A0A9N9HIG4_FUNMO|nr:2252_t:CDS:1 [Funneliformis mosseae]
MPKSIKQKNNKLVTALTINSNIDENNDNSNSILTDFKPTFPPTLTANDLINNVNKSNTFNKSRAKTFPNAFIVYRIALTKEYRNKNIKLPRMGPFSKIAKKSWEKESQDVKDVYHKLSEDAKSLYNQNNVQIIFDKHMVVNDQQSAGGAAESAYVNHDTEVFPVDTFTQNSSSEYLPEDSSPNYSFYEDPYGLNSADRELLYILDFHFKIDTHTHE